MGLNSQGKSYLKVSVIMGATLAPLTRAAELSGSQSQSESAVFPGVKVGAGVDQSHQLQARSYFYTLSSQFL